MPAFATFVVFAIPTLAIGKAVVPTTTIPAVIVPVLSFLVFIPSFSFRPFSGVLAVPVIVVVPVLSVPALTTRPDPVIPTLAVIIIEISGMFSFWVVVWILPVLMFLKL